MKNSEQCASAIPPMTHPLSRHWEQPSRDEILIDETHAAMSEETLRALKEYSCTQPTGVYPGKMWKLDRNFWAATDEEKWFLAWYGDEYEEDGRKYVSNNYREIILL